ncbi:ADP-ribose pyrophosphatase YjhB, NUDIX family [Marininema mesophilum]|uniref:ADP-ribose pyrophosphatase YjhB, NUDIX family n=1 Tax=Marininema mesophilum TaxID=1048340 RepID=A0A1H3BIN6_9BACL|nr:NUDIX hydrolase [Marininema mesophilum]SDX41830.1 ADP-ribose pyrophosphatase YjhB, NUDIX family [Marininema mesophilum]
MRGEKGLSIRVQVSCLVMKDSKIAMVKKKNRNSSVYNQFIPPGGHVELHEPLEAACIREVYEETGLRVDDLNLCGVVSFIAHTSDYHSVCFFFKTQNVAGDLKVMEPEKLTPHWIDLDSLRQNNHITDYHKAFLQEMIIENNYINAIVQWCQLDNHIEWSINNVNN